MNVSNLNPLNDISKKCPKIGIDRITSTAEFLSLKGDPFNLGAFLPGSEYCAGDYDMPDGNLSQILRGRTRGPVFYRGYRCVELTENQYSPSGDPLMRIRRIIHPDEQMARTLLTLTKRTDGSGLLERNEIELPTEIGARFRWRVVDTDYDPNEKKTVSVQHVDGLFAVQIGKQKSECLRWIRTRAAEAGGMDEAEEVYVSKQSGLTVLVRHYIGKGWPNLDDFRKCPKIEMAGNIYYLWYVRRVIHESTQP